MTTAESAPEQTANSPARYSRRVLLCVAGVSPQVITETLYALIQGDAPFVPTEIQVLTTAVGRDAVHATLLDTGRIAALLSEYGYDPAAPRLTAADVHVPRDAEGRALQDLRTAADNGAMADMMLNLVAELTQDDDCAIHASIAGGRKSMSYYLGQIMSLCGRPQDVISHVLVNAPFESHPQFFYPPREPRVLVGGDGESVRTDAARIELAIIPYVRLRRQLRKSWLDHVGTRKPLFEQAIRDAQLNMEARHVRLDLPGQALVLGDNETIRVKLSPRELSFYALAAAHRQQAGEQSGEGYAGLQRNALPVEALHRIRELADLDRAGTPRLHAADPDEQKRQVEQAMTRIDATLLNSLGPIASELYALRKSDNKTGFFGLYQLAPEQIAFRWPTGNETDTAELFKVSP